MFTVDVLGTTYEILYNTPEQDMPEGADGCMDQSTHQIKLLEFKKDRNSIQNLDAYKDKVLRHEIIHAFMYESGLWNNSGNSECWGMDETICDWFAIQSPKIFKAFQQAGCL